MIKQALASGLLKGTIRYGNTDIPCNHSPIATDRLLVAGGLSKGAEVTIIVERRLLPERFDFKHNAVLQLTAATGKVHHLKVASAGTMEGVPEFWQLTCADESQGA